MGAATQEVTVSGVTKTQLQVTIADTKALNSNGILINTVYVGYAPASAITLAANATGSTGNYTYLWSNGKKNQAISVRPTSTTTFSVEIFHGQ